MKRLIFLVAVLALINTAQAQWLNVFYPELRRVTFPTATTGYAIGNGGELLKTNDGGVSWEVKPTPFSNFLSSVFFIDENVGFIGSISNSNNGQIYRSTDGGNSWSLVNTGPFGGAAPIVNEIVMTSSLTGCAFVSAQGNFYTTSNGGITWSVSNFNPSFLHINWRANFATQQIGFLVGNGNSSNSTSSIYKTNDGGLTWGNKLEFLGVTLRSIYALDANTVYACGSGNGQGIILKSTNGGATYTTQVTDQTDLFDIQFTDANTGFALGREGISRTTNGGASWSAVSPLATASSGDLHMIDGTTGYVVKSPGIIEKTTNAWATASDIYAKPTGELRSVFFSDSQTGYVVGRNSSFLKTTNGAQTWSVANTLSTFALNATFFTNASVGYAVGDNGTILKTTDGGATWNPQTSGVTDRLNGITFLDANTGIIVGANGRILKTTNAGTSWVSKSSGTVNTLNGVSHKTGLMLSVGANGTVLKSTDSGETWVAKTSGQTVNLNSVQVVSSTLAFAGGDNGRIIKSTDGGESWSQLFTNTTSKITSVYFFDPSNGVAAGAVNGTLAVVLRTSDGGASWSSISLQGSVINSNSNLNSIYSPSPTSSIAVGAAGRVHVSVCSNPTITNQPGSQTLTAGQTLTLAVTATGTGTISYQWQRNGTNVGTNSSTLTIANVAAGDAGSYQVIVTDGCGSATSQTATVNVLAAAPGAQPTQFTLGSATANSLTFSFTAATGSPDGYIVLRRANNPVSDVPVDGVPYANGAPIGSATVVSSSANLSITDTGLSAGNVYHYAIFTYRGSANAINYLTTAPLTGTSVAAAPSAQPTQFALTGATNTSASFSFTPATGATGYLVVRKAGSAPTEVPLNTNVYAAGNSLGTATVVYSGADGTFTDSGLSTGTTYFYAVYAFRGSGISTSYLTTSPLTGNSVAAAPTAQPTQFALTGATSTSASFSFTPATGANGYLVVRKAGLAPTEVPLNTNVYAAGNSLGSATVVYAGADGTFTDSGLSTGTTYFYAVYAFRGTGISTSYLTTSPLSGNSVAAAPTAQPTQFALTGATTTSASIAFTAAAGADGYLVLRRAGAAPADVPVNTNVYEPGSILGASVVVAVGPGTSVTDSNLTTGSVYHYAIFAYRGAGVSTSYLTTTPLVGIALAPEPANHITNINFSGFTATSFSLTFSTALGNPAGYVVLRRKDAAPTAVPADGSIYTAGATVGDAVVAGVGTNTTYEQSGLDPGSRYFFQVFPYSGTGVSTNYLTTASTNNVGIGITIPAAPVAINAINTLFDTFTARWEPVTGADKYSVDISEREDFTTFLTGYQGKETTTLIETVSGLKINTTYYYRVRALNNSGASAASNVVSVKTNDVPAGTNPLQAGSPTFSTTFPADEQQQKVSITLSGGLGARTVQLFHRGITSAGAFSSVSATAATPSQFEANITRQMLDEIGVEFYLEAKDAAYTVTTNRFTVRRAFSGATSPPVPTNLFGGTLESYQIISIPLALEDNLIQTIFGSVLGEYDDTKWRLVRYQNGANVDFPAINRIELGKSYWFNSVEKVDIKSGVGAFADVSATKPFSLRLDIGWNQIATPFPFAIDWDDVLAANSNPTGVGKYRVYVSASASFTDSNVLQPFSGGFVFTERAQDLTLPVSLRATSGGRTRTSVSSSDIGSDAWQVDFTIRQGHVVNTLSGFGMHPAARLGKDDFDDITLPRFVKHLELNSYHPEFFAPRFSRDVVQTRDQHQWTFALESNFKAGEITLDWSAHEFGTNEAQLLLFDPVAGRLIDMKRVKQYTVPDGPSRELRFFYFRTPAVEMDAQLALGQAYPNPSSRQVHFDVFAPEAGQVKLEIVDVLGRKVHEQSADVRAHQVHQLTWGGTRPSGEPVEAALYFYRIRQTAGATNFFFNGRVLIK